MLCQVCLEIHMFINLMDCFLPLKTCFAWYSNWYFDPRCATWWQLFHRLNFFSGRFQKIENFVSLKKKLNSIFIISDILNSLKVKIMLWWSATEEKKIRKFYFLLFWFLYHEFSNACVLFVKSQFYQCPNLLQIYIILYLPFYFYAGASVLVWHFDAMNLCKVTNFHLKISQL